MSNSISNHTTDATHGATAVDTGDTLATPSKLDALDPKAMTSDDIVAALKLDKEQGVTHTLAEIKEILIQKYQKSSPHASATDITEFTDELLANIQRSFPELIVIPKKK